MLQHESTPEQQHTITSESTTTKLNKEQLISASFHPRLACKVNIYPEQIILVQGDRNIAWDINGQSPIALQKLFLMLDGKRSIRELQQQFFSQNPDIIINLIKDLDREGLIDDTTELNIDSGIDVILELEELTTQILNKNSAQNLFLQQLKSTNERQAISILSGLIIEHYHFLASRPAFDSVVLSFPQSKKIRQLLNERYCREYEQEKILLVALNGLGIRKENLVNVVPLPQTTALCHTLSFWANFEPIFFLTTLKFIAEQKLETFLSCLEIGKKLTLESSFIEPIKQLVKIQLKQQPESLNCLIFQEIPAIDRITKQHLKGQTYLFLEIYNNFYQAIGDYYSSEGNLLRTIEAI
ncbi:MAG: hypothetical protein Tsb0014_32200 [Pleurocapsa sp.]